MAEVSEVDLRVKRLKSIIAGETHEGRDGIYLGKLPLELFLLTIGFVAKADDSYMITATHVCMAWRKAIIGHPKLWSVLDGVDCGSLTSIDRVRTWCSRSNGGLRKLELTVTSDAIDSGLPIVACTRQILREVSSIDGARKLRHLLFDFGSYRYCSDDQPSSYLALVALAHFVEYSTTDNLKTLIIISPLPKFQLAPFFACTQSIKTLSLVSRSDTVDIVGRLPDFYTETAENQTAVSTIQSLTVVHSRLLDSEFPALPNIKSLKLYDIALPNLYGLLAKCTGTLETLWLRGVRGNNPSEFIPLPFNATVKDYPPTLLFGKLVELKVCGYQSPMLWNVPNPTSTDFMIEAPALKTICMADQEGFDFEDGIEDEYEPMSTLTLENVSKMIRTSPALTTLDLSGTNIGMADLATALQSSSHTLTKLLIKSIGTDALIEQLDTLVPNLNYLDVRRCHGRVTLPALARMADRFMKMRSQLHEGKVEDEGAMVLDAVTDGKKVLSLQILVERENTCLEHSKSVNDLRLSFKELLLQLSPTQLKYLSPTLNSPPNAPSYEVVRQAIVHLLDPIQLTPPRPLGSQTSAGSGEAKKVMMPKAAATSEVFKRAKEAMDKWQKKKENVMAEQWFDSVKGLKGIEISFNHVGDGDSDDEDDEDMY